MRGRTRQVPPAPSVEPSWQPHVLREYALLADGERAAVIGPRGDIAWLCAPGWHDPAVFSSLIGGRGSFSVTPVSPFVWGGSYDEGSMIWRSRWVTHEGIIESRDALAYPADPGRAVLLRRAHALQRPGDLIVTLEPRGDYDHNAMSNLHCHNGVWTARVGQLNLRLIGASDARPHVDGSRLDLQLQLGADAVHDIVLEFSDQSLPDQLPDPEESLSHWSV